MSVSGLLLFLIIGITLLIFHSYFTRGFRVTFNFFLFALIAAMRKEIGTFFDSRFLVSKGSPFFFPTVNVSFGTSLSVVILGWVFVFYISWIISGKIIQRLDYFRDKIFPTVLFSGIVIASISYAVEAIGINMGWWQWRFYDPRFSIFLIAWN